MVTGWAAMASDRLKAVVQREPLDAHATKTLDGGPSFSARHRILRLLWQVTWLLLASWTPPAAHAWRRFLLRLFGAKAARMSDVRGSARVWYPPNLVLEEHALLASGVICYNMAAVVVGARALVSQDAYLCGGSHDIDDPHFQLVTRPIRVEPYAWVASQAFVGPGVTVGEGAVLAARAVAVRDLEPWTVYVGNPAVPKRKRRRTVVSDSRA